MTAAQGASGTASWARREACLLALMLYLIYALTSSGDLVGDTEVRWSTARQLVDAGTLALPEGQRQLTTPGPDGRFYSWYGIGQPLCLIPFVLAGRALVTVLPFDASADMLGQFLASLILFPAFGALCVWLMYRLAWTISRSAAAARWTAFAFALGTMHWFYAVVGYEESQVAACWLGGVWLLLRYMQTAHRGWLYGGMAVFATSLVFRPSSALIIATVWMIGVFVDAAWGPLAGRSIAAARRWIVVGITAVGPFIALVAWLNYLRFGSPLETGYAQGSAAMGLGDDLFATPWLEGLGGILISPGKSVFLYNPVLLLAIPGVWLLWRRGQRFAALTAVGCVVLSVSFHAKLTFWAGDLAWGPRYQASVMGLACLGLIPMVCRSRRWQAALIILLTLSVAIQAASTTYSFGLEFRQNPGHGIIPTEYVWKPSESHITRRFVNIATDIDGRPLIRAEAPNAESEADGKEAAIAAIRYFPFKAKANLGAGRLAKALVLVWVMGIALLIATIVWWAKSLRRQPAEPSC